MQPYFFPYVGYFQLIDSVDKFIFYDDVNFIKRGFINRNFILENGKKKMFTIKLSKASQNKLINQVELFDVDNPLGDLIAVLKQNYSKAPYFNETIGLVEKINKLKYNTISDLAIKSLIIVSNHLNQKTIFETSSINHSDSFGLEKSNRLIQICKKCNSNIYVNAIGGIDLYQKEEFISKGIDLCFMQGQLDPYKQFNNDQVVGLSIIDILMFNDKKQILKMIKNYKII